MFHSVAYIFIHLALVKRISAIHYADAGLRHSGKGICMRTCDSCHKDFLIAFSCKKRGICPSCNTCAMVKTAAHLVENVVPHVAVRQFVISFPMRIRHYLQTYSILQAVLLIVVEESEKPLSLAKKYLQRSLLLFCEFSKIYPMKSNVGV